VVHCHGIEFAGDALKIARAAGVPARIAHAHNTGWCRGKKGVIMELRKLRFAAIGRRRALKHATHVLGCSNDAGRFFFGKYWGQPNTQTLCLGIPLEAFDVERTADRRRELCARYGIPEGSIVVGHVGSLTLQKNQGFLLRIFHEIAARSERYVLFIAGEGELRRELEGIVQRYGLEGRVFMPGGCDCVPELMTQVFDVFALPSLFEGLGLVLIEAAAAGLRCVCSDVIPEDCLNAIAGRGQTVPLAAPPRVWADAITSGVERRLTPKEGCEVIRKSGFDRKESLETLIGVYRTAMGGQAAN
jgi:glycosyltransferase involved in cell wall biosynthesis